MSADQPKDPKRSDGKAVVVTVNTDVEKGQFVRKPFNTTESFYGFACANASSGDEVALTVESYEFELVVPSAVTAAKGDILYVRESDGVIVDSTEMGTKHAFLKVTVAKDSNDVVWGLLLPQREDW